MLRHINKKNLIRQKTGNLLNSVMLMGGMALLLGFLGWIFAGAAGLWWVIMIGAASLIISPTLSPQVLMRWQRAMPLTPNAAPRLHGAVQELTQRAELPGRPTLYYIRSGSPNAFTVGHRNNAAIAVTDGLLRSLSMGELAAVMAHEISHLKNNDLWIMNLSSTMGRITSMLAMIGQFLFIFNLPLFFVTGSHLPWIGIFALILAPSVSMMLQLAVSRAREFEADLTAATLTGDPKSLATALSKIEQHQAGMLAGLFIPGYQRTAPSMLRTHPQTKERIRRLLELSNDRAVYQELQADYRGGNLAEYEMTHTSFKTALEPLIRKRLLREYHNGNYFLTDPIFRHWIARREVG